MARIVRSCLLWWVLAAAPSWVLAASIEVAPVSHDLPAGQTMLSMTVSNRSDAEVQLQVRAFVWSQQDGQDQLIPAAELLIAPAIFSVAPGRGQVLRVRVPPAAAGREASYRLLIDELPDAGSAGEVRMALRLSVPVFAHGLAAGAPALNARFDPARRVVTLVNTGASRARVHELALVTPGGERVVARPSSGPYVLAGAQREWTVAVDARPLQAGGAWSVVALTDGGRVEVPLVASP